MIKAGAADSDIAQAIDMKYGRNEGHSEHDGHGH